MNYQFHIYIFENIHYLTLGLLLWLDIPPFSSSSRLSSGSSRGCLWWNSFSSIMIIYCYLFNVDSKTTHTLILPSLISQDGLTITCLISEIIKYLNKGRHQKKTADLVKMALLGGGGQKNYWIFIIYKWWKTWKGGVSE